MGENRCGARSVAIRNSIIRLIPINRHPEREASLSNLPIVPKILIELGSVFRRVDWTAERCWMLIPDRERGARGIGSAYRCIDVRGMLL
jgi:hypothetical protein